MNIAVVGTGMIGRLIATELSKKHKIYAIDNNKSNLEILKKHNPEIITIELDINKNGKLNLDFAELIVNCVPGFIGFETAKRIIQKRTCIDISFMPENCLELDYTAREANTALYPDSGIAPGLSNIIIGNMTKHNHFSHMKIMVGGLPKEKNPPWNYKAPFSPIDVIEEYTRPARIRNNGKLETVDALTGLFQFDFEDIGPLEAFLTDGLRTLLDSKIAKDIPHLSEYTIRYPGHSKMISNLIDKGELDDTLKTHNGKITSQKEVTTKKLFREWKLNENDKEFTLLIIIGKTIKGEEICCTVYDEWEDGWSSMSRTTGLTACAITNLIIDKELTKTGVITPEELGTNQEYFDYIINYLKERNININFSPLKNSLKKE